MSFAGIGSVLWNFSHMMGRIVNVFQQGHKFPFKSDVIVWATQTSSAAKFAKSNATIRTTQLVELFQLLLLSQLFLLSQFFHETFSCVMNFRR